VIPSGLFQKFFERHKDDQGLMIAVGIDPMSETVPVDLARLWFEDRKRLIQRKLAKALEGDQVKLFRCMAVSEDWLIDLISGHISSVGDHWTVDAELAPFLKGGYSGSQDENNIVLEGRIAFCEVDLLDLFQASYSNDFEEFEVIPQGRVELIRIWNGSMTAILHDFEPGFFSRS
jgi:hypothetical protein